MRQQNVHTFQISKRKVTRMQIGQAIRYLARYTQDLSGVNGGGNSADIREGIEQTAAVHELRDEEQAGAMRGDAEELGDAWVAEGFVAREFAAEVGEGRGIGVQGEMLYCYGGAGVVAEVDGGEGAPAETVRG